MDKLTYEDLHPPTEAEPEEAESIEEVLKNPQFGSVREDIESLPLRVKFFCGGACLFIIIYVAIDIIRKLS